jgi:hypothetical protein
MLVLDLFQRLHIAIELIGNEAKLFCTEQEPKSDFSKLYPWHRVIRTKEENGNKCAICFPKP